MQPGLVGEAGVGKTRLVEEAAESAREAGDMAALVVVGVAGLPVVLAPALAALATAAGSVYPQCVVAVGVDHRCRRDAGSRG